MTILKKYRIDKDFGQKEMADKLNISLPAYRNYESGKRTMPHNVLAKFLQMRGLDSDLRLLEALEEFYEQK